MEAPQKPCVAILVSPGLGHLIPLSELARKLVDQLGFIVTFFIPDDGSQMKTQKALLEPLRPSITSNFLPPSDKRIPDDANVVTRIILSLVHCLPALRDSLSQLSRTARIAAFVVDTFAVISMDMVREMGIPFYVFFCGNAMNLSLLFNLPKLDAMYSSEYRDLLEPVRLPGCVPINGSDLSDPVQDRKHDNYKGFLAMSKKIVLADGILINSFLNLEPATFEALQQTGSCRRPPVYPIGPLIRSGSATNGSDDKLECLKWLDKQPTGSVLFVSFGSGGTLSSEQLKELALGLQHSKQRFLLVARSPNNESKNAAYFRNNGANKANSFEYLPPEFIEATREKGFVVSEWAPQIEVLSHRSVGGFLTHCGWNSALESIVRGVPMIAWPLYAEQRLNAVLLSEGLEVALRVRENENGVVGGEQVSRLARSLIEGEEGKDIRKRMASFKEDAAKHLRKDGSSTKYLAHVGAKWIGPSQV